MHKHTGTGNGLRSTESQGSLEAGYEQGCVGSQEDVDKMCMGVNSKWLAEAPERNTVLDTKNTQENE